MQCKDPQGRKWQLTLNNPIEKTFNHERIKCELCKLKSAIYWCIADERGNEEETLHTHIFIVFSSAVRFSTIKNLFESAHIERANGTSSENRDYLTKEGKWKNSNKSETTIEGSFEEWGELPVERQGGRSIESIIIDLIQDGATNAEILREFPHYLRGLRDVEYVRQTLRAEEYRDKWRALQTTYIWGATGAGKTRYVMDGYGYANVYAVNNYKHPFDGYAAEKCILFDEFSSGIRIQDMNNYLDGYPLTLPARYSDKQACYERVFIVSNLDLRDQYAFEQLRLPAVWSAFIRRIHKVVRFMPDGSKREYETLEYLSKSDHWKELPDDTPTPFSVELQKTNEGG